MILKFIQAEFKLLLPQPFTNLLETIKVVWIWNGYVLAVLKPTSLNSFLRNCLSYSLS